MTMESVAELLDLSDLEVEDATCFRVRVKDGAGVRELLAQKLATEIARGLLEPSDQGFTAWCERVAGGAAHADAMQDELRAYLMSDFTPTEKEVKEGSTRLRGAVVEHLWVSIAAGLAGGWGAPMHVERDHFSVIDHGADGVAVYDAGTPELRFRLWESKRFASAEGSVTDKVTEAAKQLAAEGSRYLARISKPLQLNADERVRLLAGRIVALWTNRDARSAVGVSIGRSSGGDLPMRPFIGLMRNFRYLDDVRREGVIFEIDDLDGFAEEVRGWLNRALLK